MDPLNKKERTEAFIKLLLMFLLTLIIVLIPLYYVFRMPANEKAFSNEEYEQLKEKIKKNNMNDQEFLLLTDSARSLYLEFKKEETEVNKGRINDRFSGVLNDMEDIIIRLEADSLRSDLYGHIIDAYTNLLIINNNISELKTNLKNKEDETQALKLKADLKKAEDETQASKEEKPAKVLTSQEQQIQLIKTTLEKHNGNLKNAAKELGMTERSLKRKMEDLGM